MKDDIGTVPEGWSVLYCHVCPASLCWTADAPRTYGDADTWHEAIVWAHSQIEHLHHEHEEAAV